MRWKRSFPMPRSVASPDQPLEGSCLQLPEAFWTPKAFGAASSAPFQVCQRCRIPSRDPTFHVHSVYFVAVWVSLRSKWVH